MPLQTIPHRDADDTLPAGGGRMPPSRAVRIARIGIPLAAVAIVLLLVATTVLHSAIAEALAKPLPAGVVDDTTGAAGWSGGWSVERGALYGDGTAHVSTQKGATTTYRFSGSQVSLYGAVGPGRGIAHVSVDGGDVYEVDFFAAADAGSRLLWVSAPLVGTHHRLRVEVSGEQRADATGNAVAVDGFRPVRGGVSTAAVTYSSGWTSSGSGHAAPASGGTADIAFTGAAVVVQGTVATGARGTVTLDGGSPEPLATSDGHLWSSGRLRAGAHRLHIAVASGAVVVGAARTFSRVAALPIATATASTTKGWRTYATNPVVGKNWGTAFDLAAVRRSGVYEMWFSWRPKASIAYVRSLDGISWTVPRIVLGPRAGTWESDVNRPTVLLGADGRYDMWYTGQANGASAIGFATSADGVHWTRPSTQPVLTAETWEQPSVMNASVIYDAKAATFRMWYSGGQTQEPNAIGYATSPDGRTWTRYSGNPVMQKNPAHRWEQDRVAGIQVIQQAPDSYLAYYIGYKDILSASIGAARSTDGIHWSQTLTKPLIAPVKNAWNCDAVYKPFALWDAVDRRWMLWFNGRCGGLEQLGLAVHSGADPISG